MNPGERVMARVKLAHHEPMAAVCPGGCAPVEEVHLSTIESSGSMSVIPRPSRGGEGEGGAPLSQGHHPLLGRPALTAGAGASPWPPGRRCVGKPGGGWGAAVSGRKRKGLT